MQLFDLMSLGNLQEGDSVKLYKKGQKDLASGSLLKMEDDKALALTINEEKTLVNLSTVNTLLKGEEMFANMDKEQLEDLIIALMEMAKQMKKEK